MEARVVDGLEGVSSSDIRVDWMDARNVGGGAYGGRSGGWGNGGDMGGGYGGGWDSLGLADGSVF